MGVEEDFLSWVNSHWSLVEEEGLNRQDAKDAKEFEGGLWGVDGRRDGHIQADGVADLGWRKKGNCQGLEPRFGFFAAWAEGRVWKPGSFTCGDGVAMCCLMASKTSNIERVTRAKAQRRKGGWERWWIRMFLSNVWGPSKLQFRGPGQIAW